MGGEAVADWLKVVEDDLRQVRNNLFGPEPTATGAAYHCQQAAEKLVKTVLIKENIDFPRTHDIDALISLLPVGHILIDILAPLARFTPFATAYRYPWEDEGGEPTTLDARLWLEEIERAKGTVIVHLGREDTSLS